MRDDQILVAGIGNIFLGDDAFGVEVVRELARHDLPDTVRVIDFGIRSYDLAYAIMEEYAAVIMVDATQRGELPGTLYLIEPSLNQLDDLDGELVNAHSLNPVRVLHMVKTLSGRVHSLYLLGCEPAILQTEDGKIGLSEPVSAAVPEAIEMLKSLIDRVLHEEAT